MQYLVQGLETVTFEREPHDSSLFSRQEADESKVCELKRSGLALVCLPSVYLMSLLVTKSPRPSLSVFAYCKRSKTGGERGLGTRLYTCSDFSSLPSFVTHTVHSSAFRCCLFRMFT